MAVSYYNVGTATLTQGSDAMVGQGTLWSGNVRPGDTIVSYAGQTAIVGSVNSNTSITLTRLFRGTSQAALAYDIVFAPADATVAQDVSTVLNAIRSSALVGLSGLVPAARKLPYYDAASTAALTDLTEAGRAMLALAGAADKLPYMTGASTAALTDLTAFGRSLAGAANADAALNALGIPYAVGTWTPTLTFGGASTGIAYSPSTQGRYVRFAGLAYITGWLRLTSKGTAAGGAQIEGLPFARSGGDWASPSIGRIVGMTGLAGVLGGYSNSNVMVLSQSAPTGTAGITNANFTDVTQIFFSHLMSI